jgi:hypothetical protein
MAKKAAPAPKPATAKATPAAAPSFGMMAASSSAPGGGRVTIILPASQARVLCPGGSPPGSICAQGTAVPPDGLDLVAITAFVFPGTTALSSIPTDPTTVSGTTAGIIYADTYWRFMKNDSNLIPNVDAKPSAPFPMNLLVVWATWSGSTPTFSRSILAFGGITFDRTDCETAP